MMKIVIATQKLNGRRKAMMKMAGSVLTTSVFFQFSEEGLVRALVLIGSDHMSVIATDAKWL